MGSFGTQLLRNLPKHELKINIEKASVDQTNGVAKVLFNTNLPPRKVEEALVSSELEQAFAKLLDGKAHYIANSAHYSEVAGLYYGFVKVNQPVIEHEDALKENSGFQLVVANVFADADDHMWEVQEDASGKKVLVRTSIDDLTELLSIKPNASMATASAQCSLTGSLEFASLVKFFDPASESMRDGVILDTSTAYDFESKKAVKISPTLVVASTSPVHAMERELAGIYVDKNKTFAELAEMSVKAIFDYIEAVYSQNPAYVREYKAAVSRLFPSTSR